MQGNEEDDLDMDSSAGESDNQDQNDTSDEEEEAGGDKSQGPAVIDDKLQQRNKIFFEETDRIIE